MNTFRFPRFLAVVLSLAFLFGAVQAQAGKKDDTLNIASQVEITNVDKYFNATRVGTWIQHMGWDFLLHIDRTTGKTVPALATSWKYVNDKTIELELRKGVKFHSGKEMTADDVVYTINYISDPKNPKVDKRMIDWIDHAEMLGPYKVRIVANKTYPAAPHILAGFIAIYPQGCYDKDKEQSMNLHPDGTGPYKIVEVELPKRVVLVKNNNYYSDSPKGRPSVGKIVLRVIPDINTQVAELLTGRLDLLQTVPTDVAEDLAKNPNFKVEASATMRCSYMVMDAAGRSGDTPFKKAKVRQAVAHAIDREGIVKNLIRGTAQVLHSACYPAQFGCTGEVAKYDYSPAKAKKLLAEAGYPQGFKTKFYSYYDRPTCEAVINNLKDVGITTEFQFIEFAALRSAWRKGETPILFTTWGSSSIYDVSAFTPIFFKSDKDDMTHDPEVTSWFKAGDNSVDPQVRLANYGKAYKKIADQAYWLPMYTVNMNYVYSRDLDFKPTPDELPQFYNTRWK
jgi:peptide/nickel transport system substrate-binding protein